VVTIFITRLLQGLPCTIYGDGQQCRDFVHVSDIVQACLAAGRAAAAVGQRINIGSGRGTTVNELAVLVARLMRVEGKFTYEPQPPGELRQSVADISLAARLLDYVPQAKLEERLVEVVESLRQQAHEVA
jgi:nucleoside-diphosphate-sugar epimerase